MSPRLLLPILSILLWQAYAQQGTNSGSITVDSSGGTVSTRVGCYQELECSGIGTSIGWRLFGVRVDLANDTEDETDQQFVVTSSEPVPGEPEGIYRWTSRLIYPSVTVRRSASYSCSVYDDLRGDGSAEIVTVQVRVEPEPMVIEPPIENRDISSYYVGDPLLIGCPVHTCARGVTVQFLRNDSVVATGMPSNTDESVYATSITVGPDTAGTYMCLVTADIADGRAIQAFNITGTPMVRPTDPVITSGSPSGDTNAMPTTPGDVDATQTTRSGHGIQITPALSLLFLLVLGAWLCV